MSAHVDDKIKCNFANLKYEQLLAEKYFVESCFSKKYESYTAKEMLKDMFLRIKLACK